MSGDLLLEVKDLSVVFTQGGRQTVAVDRVSFEIRKGETVALVGESGSGKSVTALSVLKLLPYPAASHPSGEIAFRGQDLLRMAEDQIRRVRGNNITIIFQEPMTSLNPLHTIERQIGEILLLHRGLTGAPARARTIELLRQVGIPDPEGRLSSYPHQLSGGQRQRVMIAMALANEPDLLIADEPTTALDVTIQAQILELMRKLQDEQGMAILLITHDLGVVASVCHRVLVMYGGRVVEEARRLPYLKIGEYLRLVDDLPEHLLDEVGNFFEVYKLLEPNKDTTVKGWEGRAAAESEIKAALARHGH